MSSFFFVNDSYNIIDGLILKDSIVKVKFYDSYNYIFIKIEILASYDKFFIGLLFSNDLSCIGNVLMSWL